MLADGRRLTVISSTETRLTLGLATGGERRHGKVPGVLFAKRYRITKQPEFQRISADCSAAILYFRTFDKAENHEPLHHGIGRIDRPNNALLATL